MTTPVRHVGAPPGPQGSERVASSRQAAEPTEATQAADMAVHLHRLKGWDFGLSEL
jgi:hypothetical protein